MAKFKKGKSGNPKGRPVGAKNQITLLKEAMELALRERAQNHLLEVMDMCLTLAKSGDQAMIKLLLDLHMSKGTTQDHSKAAEKVEININGPEVKEVKKEITVPLEEAALLLASTEEVK